MIVVWPNWPSCQPLQRIWCVWEIYAALVAELPLGIALTESDKLNLNEELLDNFHTLVVNMSEFDVRKAKSYDRRMRKRTLQAVAKHEENFYQFNETSIAAVRQWWALQGFEKLAELINEYENIQDPGAISKLLKFVNSLSHLSKLSVRSACCYYCSCCYHAPCSAH